MPDGIFWKMLVTGLTLANIGMLKYTNTQSLVCLAHTVLLAINIADAVLDDIQNQRTFIENFPIDLDWIAPLASFIVNLLATVLILWKWW